MHAGNRSMEDIVSTPIFIFRGGGSSERDENTRIIYGWMNVTDLFESIRCDLRRERSGVSRKLSVEQNADEWALGRWRKRVESIR